MPKNQIKSCKQIQFLYTLHMWDELKNTNNERSTVKKYSMFSPDSEHQLQLRHCSTHYILIKVSLLAASNILNFLRKNSVP